MGRDGCGAASGPRARGTARGGRNCRTCWRHGLVFVGPRRLGEQLRGSVLRPRQHYAGGGAVTPAVDARPMAGGDVAELVPLQRQFLRGSIVAELGESFLTRFHLAALAHAGTRAFVTESAGTIAGLV